MTEEQQPPVEPRKRTFEDITGEWEKLEPGLKAQAMRAVYEDQQRLVADLQHMHMEKGKAIATAVAKAKAAADMDQEALKAQIISEACLPLEEELKALEQQIREGRLLLVQYTKQAKGII